MSSLHFQLTQALPAQARQIATLIMEAMSEECCRYFAGETHSLTDFHEMMTRLVGREDSQYSYRNTLVATDEKGNVVGICVSYDGALLHSLRKTFVTACREHFHRDFSDMDDETASGELYIDSLAVCAPLRGKGIAQALLNATIKKGRELGLPAVGLLVDTGNPLAERLYRRVGFRYVDNNVWGGHSMRHLQYVLR